MNLKQFALKNDFNFVLTQWGGSRLIILLAMWGIAPFLKVPSGSDPPMIGWQAFAWWDGLWYIQIATEGYEYINDGQEHSVAFFPLFPLLMRALMTVGIAPELAGVLINNAAFFGAMLLLYRWLREHHGETVARWGTATLAWCPYSLYGSVVYTEGLFLLLTTATLWAFEKEQYGKVALLGGLATATRSPGIMMIPALLMMAWGEKRPPRAYLASVAVAGGIVLYSLYCGWQFGNPFAFVEVQEAWGRTRTVDWFDWWRVLMYVVIGVSNWDAGTLKEVGHPLTVALVSFLGLVFWRFRHPLGAISAYGTVVLLMILWLLGGDSFLTLSMVWGGIFLLLWTFQRIRPVATLYGLFNLALILTSGRSESSERLAYGIMSLPMAAGVLLSQYPRFGYGLMGFFALVLATFAIRFAQQLWIA